MSPEQALLVLKWQMAAAFFMGLEYFFPTSWRRWLDKVLWTEFFRIQNNVDASIIEASKEFFASIPKVIGSIIYIITGVLLFWLGIQVEKYVVELDWVLISIMIIFYLFSLVFIVIGFNQFLDKTMKYITILGTAAPFRIFTTFTTKSPKGPAASVGFLCLLVSFSLRYRYLNA